MPALVIKSFPEPLHARLRQIAARHRRAVTQETIHLIDKALANTLALPDFFLQAEVIHGCGSGKFQF